ncbi:MAG: hypothetical protein REI95_01250 [Oxalicibacterium faecigallinarum]|uniref:Uncharacterized protein n=1 Tax=Oxalicibacterium faecigallinarum TaxID=573741 RepID=A0A8J3ASK7_9BURK|nr:hypothetical protein [Oxalicibacterium faecigallinarum]MDQ7968243.1 hypothetical protein [Oxalicibacterium faecigallinarum]GGI20748.1 hypothetical protein GCM10008066_25580 [Oxalicibacterium faecigallinarum]
MATNMSGESVSQCTLHLIEEQLQVLPISIATIMQADEVGETASQLLSKLFLKRKPRHKKTGSAGNIVAEEAQPSEDIDFHEASEYLREHPLEKMDYARVLVSNSLLSVGIYMRDHDMASMRTPEFQFLGHVVNALLNNNRFKVNEGYMPMATFDGLVIDSSLNGTRVFAEKGEDGFLEFGDAVALLQWLSRYLRGEKRFVSGGDAG